MSGERNKRVWPWIVAWSMGLLVLYPLSVGPAIWLVVTFEGPPWIGDAFRWLYSPLEFVVGAAPAQFQTLFREYVDLWWRLTDGHYLPSY